MKRQRLLLIGLTTWLFALVGCGHLDLTPESDPNRVMVGTVNVRADLILPPDAEVVVRVLEPQDVNAAPAAAAHDLVIGERGSQVRPERILGEQVIRTPSGMPIPFRIEYRADDTQLRRGVNIEARMTWGGRLRFRTVQAQVVTLSTAETPQTVWVEPVQ